jgi:hypothetical protein
MKLPSLPHFGDGEEVFSGTAYRHGASGGAANVGIDDRYCGAAAELPAGPYSLPR